MSELTIAINQRFEFYFPKTLDMPQILMKLRYRRAGSENKNTKLAPYLIAYKADRMISM